MFSLAQGFEKMSCGGCAAAAVPSGSEAYAKLYPEKSSDGVLRLGNVVPGRNGLLLGASSALATILLLYEIYL